MPFKIEPVDSEKPIQDGALCQEASFLSIQNYIPCNRTAVAVIRHRGERDYLMCAACADHNLRNRRAQLVRVKNDWKGIAAGIDPATYKVDQ
jgi:hypothetical protein